MSSSSFLAKARQHIAVGTSLFALLANLVGPATVAAQAPAKQPGTASPIKHVIVIIGENAPSITFSLPTSRSRGKRLQSALEGHRQVRRHSRPELFALRTELRN
jgi:hypothetical protein